MTRPVLITRKTGRSGEATFHCFGSDYEEFDGGPGVYSTAIVEWPDGQVEGVPVAWVQFTEPPPAPSAPAGSLMEREANS